MADKTGTEPTIKIMKGLRQAASGLQEAIEDNLANATKENRQVDVAKQNLDAFHDLLNYAYKYHLIGISEINGMTADYRSLKDKYAKKAGQR